MNNVPWKEIKERHIFQQEPIDTIAQIYNISSAEIREYAKDHNWSEDVRYVAQRMADELTLEKIRIAKRLYTLSSKFLDELEPYINKMQTNGFLLLPKEYRANTIAEKLLDFMTEVTLNNQATQPILDEIPRRLQYVGGYDPNRI